MDPNANLSDQLGCARKILAVAYGPTTHYSAEETVEMLNEAVTLAELVEALDTWLSSGGFLPERWQHNRKRP